MIMGINPTGATVFKGKKLLLSGIYPDLLISSLNLKRKKSLKNHKKV